MRIQNAQMCSAISAKARVSQCELLAMNGVYDVYLLCVRVTCRTLIKHKFHYICVNIFEFHRIVTSRGQRVTKPKGHTSI